MTKASDNQAVRERRALRAAGWEWSELYKKWYLGSVMRGFYTKTEALALIQSPEKKKLKESEYAFLKNRGWHYRAAIGKQPAGYVHKDYRGRFSKQEALTESGWKP